MPSWLSKSLVLLVSAALIPALVVGTTWVFEHPLPDGALMPAAMVTGLAVMVYGVRKNR